jgi:hypothetical protein
MKQLVVRTLRQNLSRLPEIPTELPPATLPPAPLPSPSPASVAAASDPAAAVTQPGVAKSYDALSNLSLF